MAIFEVTHLNGVEADTPYDAVFTPESVTAPAQENADGDVVISVRRGTPDGAIDAYTVSDSLADVNEGLSIGTSGAQAASARVTSMSSASTDAEYPSALAAYTADMAVAGQVRVISEVSGFLLDGDAAGTYPLGAGNQLVASGGNQVAPIGLIYIHSTQFATVNGVASDLYVAAQLSVNNAAPVGNFTVGLYPVTVNAASGGAGNIVYDLGTLVAGSQATVFTAPAADALAQSVSASFAVPANGFYCIGVLTSATLAANSMVVINAQLKAANVA